MTTLTKQYRYLWQRDRDAGLPRTVDPAPAVAHARRMRAAGMSYGAMEAATGVSAATMCALVTGTHGPTIRRVTSEAVLAGSVIPVVEPTGREVFVSNVGARRRIRALLAIGWTHEAMHERSGIRTSVALNQAGEWITSRKHRAIAAMYDELSMTPGPSQRTRDRAARAGYEPPLAWDELSIDDPVAMPYFEDTDEPGDGVLALAEDAVWLMSQDAHTWDTLADRLDASRYRLRRALDKANRPDLIDELRRNTDAVTPDARWEAQVA